MIGNTSHYSTIFHSYPTTLKAMKYSFYLKTDYKNKDGKYPLYINLYIHGQRKRIPADIFLKKTDWDAKKQLIKNPELDIHNLILKKIKAQINDIEISFRLGNQVLTVEKCAELIKYPDIGIDFIPFMEYELELKEISFDTKDNHKVVLEKLKEYKSSIIFGDINDTFIKKFRKHLSSKKNNAEVTIDSNIKIIKHYIKLAKKRGFIINIDLDDVKIKQHKSHRTNLTIKEVDRMKEYYFSSFIPEHQRRVLGYFLFNCMTGLRIEDLRKLNRHELTDCYFNFWNQKSKKQQILMTNETCRKILDHDLSLFINKITAKTINETIKVICSFLGIRKKVSAHVARHTFATNYLRKGGKVEDLQILLGHSKISTTMIYVHIIEDEVVDTMTLLD